MSLRTSNKSKNGCELKLSEWKASTMTIRPPLLLTKYTLPSLSLIYQVVGYLATSFDFCKSGFIFIVYFVLFSIHVSLFYFLFYFSILDI